MFAADFATNVHVPYILSVSFCVSNLEQDVITFLDHMLALQSSVLICSVDLESMDIASFLNLFVLCQALHRFTTWIWSVLSLGLTHWMAATCLHI